jgi:hypothetical protein
MQFKLRKASDHFMEHLEDVDVSTLEDLQELCLHYDKELIVDFRDNTIVVYDSYIE